MPEATFMGVPRSKIPWYPRINYEKCNLCEGYPTPKCIEFCAHFVFDIVEEATSMPDARSNHISRQGRN